MKTFEQFLTEAKQINEASDDKFDRYSKDIAPYLPKKVSSKYKKGEFGYWWVEIEGNEDIEGKVYNGDINCSHEDLTSLKGCPKEVDGDFICNYNQLTSLKGCPKEVGGDFECYNNQLTSLKGAPKVAEGDFYCWNNQLTSLEGCPQKVKGTFICDNNKLTSLEGCPKEVKGSFSCEKNNKEFTYEEVKSLCRVRRNIHI